MSAANWKCWLLALVVALPGLAMRWRATPEPFYANSDAGLYRAAALTLESGGWTGLQGLTEAYRGHMREKDFEAKLPPTRLLFPVMGLVWKRLFWGAAPPVDMMQPEATAHDPMWASLRRVAAAGSCVMLLAAGFFTWRMMGGAAALGVLALLGCSPLEIHMGQHALVDGVLALWTTLALGALWQCLQEPERRGWFALLGVSICAMVLTKESALFPYLAMAGTVIANRWLHLGRVTRLLLATMALAPLPALLVLVLQTGGVSGFLEIYRLFAAKALVLDYAIQTQDGPWYRYLVDLLVLSPAVFLLAVAAVLQTERREPPTALEPFGSAASRAQLFLVSFVLQSLLPMANLRYGLNLRFATIWDWPLRALAVGTLLWLLREQPRRRGLVLFGVIIAVLSLYDLRQYVVLFLANDLYELPTELLLRGVRILK